jgi:hypothetical protein
MGARTGFPFRQLSFVHALLSFGKSASSAIALLTPLIQICCEQSPTTGTYLGVGKPSSIENEHAPVLALHESSVHGFPSLHGFCALQSMVHTPALHKPAASPRKHDAPSASISCCGEPLAQLSAVQDSRSSGKSMSSAICVNLPSAHEPC